MDMTITRPVNTMTPPVNGNGYNGSNGVHSSYVRELNSSIQQEAGFIPALLGEINKVMVGQEALVERVLIALLADGHVLLEGVPGLAKTLLIKTVAQAIQADFSRIQFTPDLLPADLVGTQIYNPRTHEFTVHQGPVFANLVLADEINRAPAKVQSALLEAMQERQVTIGDTTYRMDDLFLVMATMNPIEQEGTYPLPEAQVDRFMLKARVDYPNRAEERLIMERMTGAALPVVTPVVTPADILRARAGRQAGLRGREDQGLRAGPGDPHPPAGQQRPGRPQHPDPVRRLAARQHQPDPGRPRPRLPARPRLRHARGHQGHRPRRPAPPHHHDLRGRGREHHQRPHRAADFGLYAGTVKKTHE